MAVNQTHPGNPVNEATPKRVHARSKFNMSYKLFQTQRFGEITPFFVMETVDGDKITLQSKHNVRTLNLKSPMMQNLSMKKDYFNVPMEAIMPLNWDKIFTNPLIGEEAPEDANTIINYTKLEYALLRAKDLIVLMLNAQQQAVKESGMYNAFSFMLLMEKLYSPGSLINALGAKLNKRINYTKNNKESNISTAIEDAFKLLKPGSYTFKDIDGSNKGEYNFTENTTTARHRLIELLRENPKFTINSVTGFNDMATILANIEFPEDPEDLKLNISRIWAYNIIINHFYSNDKVDYVYSAELYRQQQNYLNRKMLNKYGSTEYDGASTFTTNGITYNYDFLAGHFTNKIVDKYITEPLNDTNNPTGDLAIFFANFLNFKRSLRFVDYFTGSKTQPLAVGDTDVNVNAGVVSVIDITQKIQAQRYLNAVNRAGRKFEDYLAGIFGIRPAYDFHNPMYLAHTTDIVYGQETENTGADQLTKESTITTNLRSNASKYAFQFESDRPSILMGLCYYDIERAYANGIDRFYNHMNRFDMFNPFMQMIGDQPIYGTEINSKREQSSYFGYQLRHMEYKQRTNQVTGGFVNNLPSWIFIADNIKYKNDTYNIGPEYIRSSNVELDEFYISVIFNTLDKYFHFIVENDNIVEASRPMIYAPSIL